VDYRDAELRTAGSGSKKAESGANEFLRGLRHLRKQAGLGHAEVAARAHYPREVIKTAESGPSLPDLPLLAAFVRGCGGSGADVEEWEDWWRTAAGVPTVPLLSGRGARDSHPATAGYAPVPEPRRPVTDPRGMVPDPRRMVPEPGPRGMSASSEQPAMPDFALAMVVIAASVVCALAILTTIFA
jgi:hypothetical protein